jgi:class 3 adenylate cyclase
MSSSSSSSTPPTEQRLLAAIVFTDVAGFSTRVEREESVTLALLERDFLTMRLFSSMFGGTVIKSTGDGLLLYFTSAVQAVEWALKTQRHFADQITELPADDVLKHRIGIHLGDIFVGGGDVMGDGVNVAARVQAEARPGGICISQVVHGIVKNKLKLDVVRLETRKLKNINETIQMYHVLLEAPANKPASAPVPKVEVKAAESTSLLNGRNFLVVGVMAAMAITGVVLFRAQKAHEAQMAGSHQVLNALDAALQSQAAPPAPAPADSVPTPDTPAASKAETPAAPKTAADEFDFIKLTTTRPARGTTAAEQRALRQAKESIQVLDTWRANALARYTRAKPLAVPLLSAGAPKPLTVYADADRQLIFAEGGATRKRPWQDVEPDVQGAIVASLLMNSPVPLTRDVMRGAEAFAYVHGLPELAEKLVR